MCGIAGIYDTQSVASEALVYAASMAARLHPRGPDDAGSWQDAATGIGLAHRRLSVLDLSPQGHQPMHSASGRYVVVFNGEIYNWRELRAELEAAGAAPAWRGHSDTEVMLAAFEHWGVVATLGRLLGMFAFGVWDRQERLLTLARDRLGEKPLYYGWAGGSFVFASELKALRAHPGFDRSVDRQSLALLLRFNYIPAPHAIHPQSRKLQPGHYLQLRSGTASGHWPQPQAYWQLQQVVAERRTDRYREPAQALAALDGLLRDAVGRQMLADVPLGAFLSGGVDSSLIVALMQQQSARPVRTFTIGFGESDYNEAEYARQVATHLGTDHTELYVTPQQALDVIPRLPEIYDEPYSDSSQVPTFLVAQLARRHVTVSLSGDGGDELFGGYNRYFWMRSIWHRFGRMPGGLRRGASATIAALPPAGWDGLWKLVMPLLPGYLRTRSLGEKMHKLAEVLGAGSEVELYWQLVSHWRNPEQVVRGALPLPLSQLSPEYDHPELPLVERMMLWDTLSYLPDDLLVKVDRAAMAVSLETRVPFLDHRVVEFAWSLPLDWKIRDGQGKWLLRELLYRYVPRELIERPKMGFAVPIDTWLRGPLREWAEDLLGEERLRREGYFEPGQVRSKLAEHVSGRRNWQYYLWDVLMFQGWLDAQRG